MFDLRKPKTTRPDATRFHAWTGPGDPERLLGGRYSGKGLLMTRLARWYFRYRRLVLAGWLLAPVLFTAVSRSAGIS